MSIPNKIYHFLGYNNLGLLIEQERKHWLMKVDAKKQITELSTGNVYQGDLENIGSDIIVESKKMPIRNDHHLAIDFQDGNLDKTLSLEYSAFPYSAGVSGLMYLCMQSTTYRTKDEQGNSVYNNYRLRLKNCEIVSLPIAGSLNSPEVFVSQWLRTTTPPSLFIPGIDPSAFTEEIKLAFVMKCPECKKHQTTTDTEVGEYHRHFCTFCGQEVKGIDCTTCDPIETENVTKKYCSACGVELKYGTEITNLEYLYPLTETLQPLALTRMKDGEYISEIVNNDSFLGYPLLWFNCDQTCLGPTIQIQNNKNERGEHIFLISNEGNASNYKSKIYCGINGNLNATPDGETTTNYEIRVKPNEGLKFYHSEKDASIPLNPEIVLYNKNRNQTYHVSFVIPSHTKITMSSLSTWNYVDQEEYVIDMATFDSNNVNINQTALESIFDIAFDESIPFTNETKDIGYAGMRTSSANISSDVYDKYPHDLNEWDGLPWYLNELHPWSSPQHNVLYAIHNSPGYTPGIPNSRQVAALLMDPGLSPWVHQRDSSDDVTESPKGLVFSAGESRWSQIKLYQQTSDFATTLPSYYQINPIKTPGITNSRMIESGIYSVSFGDVELKVTVRDSDDYEESSQVWVRIEKWELCSELPYMIPSEELKLLLQPTSTDRHIIQAQSIQLERHNSSGVVEVNELGPIFELSITSEHYNWLMHGMVEDQNIRGLRLTLSTKKTHFWTIKSIGSGYAVGDEFEFNVGPVQVQGRIRRIIDKPEPNYQDTPTYEYSLIFMDNDGFVPAPFLKDGPVIDYSTSSQFQLRCPVCRDGDNLPWDGEDEYNPSFDLREPKPTHCNKCNSALLRGRGTGLVMTLHVDPLYWNWLLSAGMLDNDQRGRVYVISNDPATYENNETTTFPKPARTVARICDIPTHIGQLQNVNGMEQFPVVDPQYVRNTASFQEEDLNRIRNTHASRWVRPIHVDKHEKPVSERENENHNYIFKTIEALQAVDLVGHNEFRFTTNLNVLVDPRFVQIAEIIDHGEGYEEGDSGIIIVGGFSFSFEVKRTHPLRQGGKGEVLELEFYPTYPSLKFHLSNFDMQVVDQPVGITIPYGTANVRGKGEGLTVTMRIMNYEQLCPIKGEIFDDLYAFVDMEDGLWMWNYRILPSDTQKPRIGTWEKEVQLSFKDHVPVQKGEDPIATLEVRESFLSNIIPSLVPIRVNRIRDYQEPTTVIGYKTANFINIIDKEKTPFQTLENDENCVDLSKFVCNEIIPVNETLPAKTGAAVFNWLKTNHRLWFDCYVIWRWINPGTIGDSSTDYRFEYGIITRSFNNFVSSDRISQLPSSQLRYKKYIHTNMGTHVVWSMDNIGTMMWTYNPNAKIKESYYYDEKIKEMKRKPMQPFTWADIDIRSYDTATTTKIVDKEGFILWNVMTNNPIQANPTNTMDDSEPIYQQPEFTDPHWIKQGTKVVSIDTDTGRKTPMIQQPIGMWQLVFPNMTQFSLRTKNPELPIQQFDPIRLQAIRTKDLDSDVVIEDSHGNNVNHKTLLIDQSENQMRLRVYHEQDGKWRDL